VLEHGDAAPVPALPHQQKQGLAYCFKVPLVCVNVQIRGWSAFKKLGVGAAYCPGS
jgi:hypothetical protein